jgi:hypothetical protein
MKSTLIILAIVALCSCSKKGGESGEIRDLYNKWEVRETYGGWAGTQTYPPGNGSVLELKSDKTYLSYYQNTVQISGTYSVQSTSERYQYKVTFHRDGYDNIDDVIVKGDTLKILPKCCDIPGGTYVKIK